MLLRCEWCARQGVEWCATCLQYLLQPTAAMAEEGRRKVRSFCVCVSLTGRDLVVKNKREVSELTSFVCAKAFVCAKHSFVLSIRLC